MLTMRGLFFLTSRVIGRLAPEHVEVSGLIVEREVVLGHSAGLGCGA